MSTDITQRQRELDDARLALTRYRRMCALLFLGALAGIMGTAFCGVAQVVWGFGGEVWWLGVPMFALIFACGAAFISVVFAANERGRLHPAEKVRRAQHAYDDALDAAIAED